MNWIYGEDLLATSGMFEAALVDFFLPRELPREVGQWKSGKQLWSYSFIILSYLFHQISSTVAVNVISHAWGQRSIHHRCVSNRILSLHRSLLCHTRCTLCTYWQSASISTWKYFLKSSGAVVNLSAEVWKCAIWDTSHVIVTHTACNMYVCTCVHVPLLDVFHDAAATTLGSCGNSDPAHRENTTGH